MCVDVNKFHMIGYDLLWAILLIYIAYKSEYN